MKSSGFPKTRQPIARAKFGGTFQKLCRWLRILNSVHGESFGYALTLQIALRFSNRGGLFVERPQHRFLIQIV